MTQINPVSVIMKKRDGGVLSRDEIFSIVNGFTDGNIPDYQMSSFLMSTYLQGMNAKETAFLTDSMLHSGKIIQAHNKKIPRIDKHSTGGVGDKTSIILAPLLACLGVSIPMISGRGLGHTGGTCDKLEGIPGFKLDIGLERFEELVSSIGCGLISQTDEICPADRKIYALRDVTGTVSSIPLIVASIMSKKLAEGIDGLVLDLKVGSGAFMKNMKDARALARALVSTAKHANKKVSLLISDMSQPLGREVGNNNEINECVALLRNGPCDSSPDPRLKELSLRLAIEMYTMAEKVRSPKNKVNAKKVRAILEEAIDTGRAYAKLLEIISLQGGDTVAVDEGLPTAKIKLDVLAQKSGYVKRMDTESIGMTLIDLGGGRLTSDQDIDHTVGFSFKKAIGDKVKKGESLVEISANTKSEAIAAQKRILESIDVSSRKVARPKLVKEKY